jgi:predicted small secreted protein
MKSCLFFLSLASLSLLLNGCNFDESFEKDQQHDGDDMNVIQTV